LIYLHDTNNRTLFAQDYRALSHGCVRVERWDELVAFVLDMDITRVHTLANGQRTFDAPAPLISVTLAYFTRFPDAAGRMVTHPDVYGLNTTSQLLEKDNTSTTTACAEATSVE
jgi:murein L,D-transpeptidase YcbB/YkuD